MTCIGRADQLNLVFRPARHISLFPHFSKGQPVQTWNTNQIYTTSQAQQASLTVSSMNWPASNRRIPATPQLNQTRPGHKAHSSQSHRKTHYHDSHHPNSLESNLSYSHYTVSSLMISSQPWTSWTGDSCSGL